MKKISRVFILLLTAGALFMGCNPSSGGTNGGDDSIDGSGNGTTNSNGAPDVSINVDTSTLSPTTGGITLSDGTWKMTEVYTGSDTEGSEPSNGGRKIIYTFTVSGNSATITGGSIVKFQTITLADDDEVARVKNNKEIEAGTQRAGGKNAAVSVNGRTLTYAVSGDLSSREIDNANAWYDKPEDFYSTFISKATVMKNDSNSVFYAIWQDDYEEDMVKARTYENATYAVIFEKN